MKRRALFLRMLGAAAASRLARANAPLAPIKAASHEHKVLRHAFSIAETGSDPASISGTSNTIASDTFDVPLQVAFLGAPARMRPHTLVAMPEVSDDYKTFTLRVKSGIYFGGDPVFKGRQRELVAADYVYSYKCLYDPKNAASFPFLLEDAKVFGLSELRREALACHRAFDYDREVDGLRALDRYNIQMRLAQSAPRFLLNLTGSAWAGAVAREVVEFHGERIAEYPVGTGPFRLAACKRVSKIVLERNPDFRELSYNDPAYNRIFEKQRPKARWHGARSGVARGQAAARGLQALRGACAPPLLGLGPALGHWISHNSFIRSAWRYLDIDMKLQHQLAR